MNITRDTAALFINLSSYRRRHILREGCIVPELRIDEEYFNLVIRPSYADGFSVLKITGGVLAINPYTEEIPPPPSWENL